MNKHSVKFDWLEGSYVYGALYVNGNKYGRCVITCKGLNDYLLTIYKGDEVIRVPSNYWMGIEHQLEYLRGSSIEIRWDECSEVKGNLIGYEPTLTLYRASDTVLPTYGVKDKDSSIITEGRCPLEVLLLFSHKVIHKTKLKYSLTISKLKRNVLIPSVKFRRLDEEELLENSLHNRQKEITIITCNSKRNLPSYGLYKSIRAITGNLREHLPTGVFYLEGSDVSDKIIVVYKGFIYLELPPELLEVLDKHWLVLPQVIHTWVYRKPIGVIETFSWEDLVYVLLDNKNPLHRDFDSVCKVLRVMRRLNMVGRNMNMFYINPSIIPCFKA